MTDDEIGKQYDLYEDVIVKIRFGGSVTKAQQHQQLARIAAAEREACIAICETIANDLHYTGDVERCILTMKSRIIAGRGDASRIVGFVLGAMS